jgi:hypothetical protein
MFEDLQYLFKALCPNYDCIIGEPRISDIDGERPLRMDNFTVER